jgi:hypothetical protein
MIAWTIHSKRGRPGVVMQGAATDPDITGGLIQQHARRAPDGSAPSNVAPIPTRPRMIG